MDAPGTRHWHLPARRHRSGGPLPSGAPAATSLQRLFSGDSRVAPPQLMNFEEMEWLHRRLTDGSVQLSQLLLQREATYRGGSLKNYLARNALMLQQSAMMSDTHTRFRLAISEAVRRLGLPEHS